MYGFCLFVLFVLFGRIGMHESFFTLLSGVCLILSLVQWRKSLLVKSTSGGSGSTGGHSDYNDPIDTTRYFREDNGTCHDIEDSTWTEDYCGHFRSEYTSITLERDHHGDLHEVY